MSKTNYLAGCIIISVLILFFITGITGCNRTGDNDVLGKDMEKVTSNLMVMDISLSEEPYGIGVNKEDTQLLEKVNEFISYMKDNGKFDEIISHYEEGETPQPVKSAELNESDNQLVVATTGEFEPFDYDIGNDHYGIDREIAAALAEYLGKELVLVNTNFDIMFLSVYEHKCDICIAGITIKEEREKYVNFSDPYYVAMLSPAIKKSNDSLKDATSKEEFDRILKEKGNNFKFGVENQTTGLFYLEDGATYGHDDFSLNIMKYENLSEALDSLDEGEVDCIIGDHAVLKYIISTLK